MNDFFNFLNIFITVHFNHYYQNFLRYVLIIAFLPFFLCKQIKAQDPINWHGPNELIAEIFWTTFGTQEGTFTLSSNETYILDYSQSGDLTIQQLQVFINGYKVDNHGQFFGHKFFPTEFYNTIEFSGTADGDHCDEATVNFSISTKLGQTLYTGSYTIKGSTIPGSTYGILPSGPELILRDSELDQGREPNKESNTEDLPRDYFNSPDLWVRRYADGNENHQNPDYVSNPINANKVYARIWNIGCQTSSSTSLRLFWTKAHTNEIWKNHWFDPSTTEGQGNATYGGHPFGGEITISDPRDPTSSSDPYSVPAIDPGESHKITPVDWYPPDPNWYTEDDGSFTGPKHNRPVICLLARLYQPWWEVSPIPVFWYVYYNNNVVSRNTFLTDDPNYIVDPDDGTWNTGWATITVSRAAEADNNSLEFINETSASEGNPDITNYGNIFIMMNDDLYTEWQNDGSNSNGVTYLDSNTFLVTDPDYVSFDSLSLDTTTNYTIGIQFEFVEDSLDDSTYNYTYVLYQNNADTSDTTVYCNNVFQATVPGQSPLSKRKLDIKESESFGSGIKVTPNPFISATRITFELKKASPVSAYVLDARGKLVKTVFDNAILNAGTRTLDVRTDDLSSGIYFIKIETEMNSYSVKVVKK